MGGKRNFNVGLQKFNLQAKEQSFLCSIFLFQLPLTVNSEPPPDTARNFDVAEVKQLEFGMLLRHVIDW